MPLIDMELDVALVSSVTVTTDSLGGKGNICIQGSKQHFKLNSKSPKDLAY